MVIMKFLNPLLSKKICHFAPFFLIGVFSVWIIVHAPLKETFEYNVDEGINSMKSLLYLKGFSLYKQIWSDQPPLFTALLAFCFKIFGPTLYHGRLMVLGFSALLLWAFYQTVKIDSGIIPATFGTILLTLSVAYARLSASVMLGIPALALAMLSIYFLTLYQKSQIRVGLLLSATFMALSLQTKFFAAFLIPIVIFKIISAKNLRKDTNKTLAPFLSWLISFFALYLAITIIYFGFDAHLFINQLFRPHLEKLTTSKSTNIALWIMLLQDYDILILALLGIILCLRCKKQEFHLPAFWLIFTSLLLSFHKPIWYHYYLLISIPICWLASLGASQFIQDFFPSRPPAINLKKRHSILGLLCAAMILIILLGLPMKYKRVQNDISDKTNWQEINMLGLLSKYKSKTRWIATDMPTAAFNANILVPPEIAVATVKRRFASAEEQKYFLDILKRYKPEQILIGRFQDYGPKIMEYIKNDYLEVLEETIPWKESGHPKGYTYLLYWRSVNPQLFNKIWPNSRQPCLYLPFLKRRDLNLYRTDVAIKLFIRKDILATNK
jgi:4-amino-4-deoxy-L-arabinose transferase-like glycosyltransferase